MTNESFPNQRMGIMCSVGSIPFESITEAQWYSYFMKFGMKPEPQPDTILLGQNHVYTPDFFLPVQDTYVEIKYCNITEDTYRNARLLAVETGKMVLLIDGRPKDPDTKLYFFGSGDQDAAESETYVPISYSMSDLKDLEFFDGIMYPYSRNVDPEAVEAMREGRESARLEAKANAVNMSPEEAAEMIDELEKLFGKS